MFINPRNRCCNVPHRFHPYKTKTIILMNIFFKDGYKPSADILADNVPLNNYIFEIEDKEIQN
jgi:hypothetical protein